MSLFNDKQRGMRLIWPSFQKAGDWSCNACFRILLNVVGLDMSVQIYCRIKFFETFLKRNFNKMNFRILSLRPVRFLQ